MTDIQTLGGVPGVPTTAPAVPNPADAYRSPYTQSVLDSALSQLDTFGKKRRNELGTAAFQSGAYGDARHGVEDALLTKDLGKTAGDLTSSINSDAFDKAMGWLNTDIDRQTNTQISNANLDNQWFSNQLQAMGLGNSLFQNSLTQGQSYADALLGLDQYDKGTNQDQINVNYDDWLTEQGWDSAKLNEFLNIVNGVPGQTSTESSSPNNSWASMLGAALGNVKTSDGSKLFG